MLQKEINFCYLYLRFLLNKPSILQIIKSMKMVNKIFNGGIVMLRKELREHFRKILDCEMNKTRLLNK